LKIITTIPPYAPFLDELLSHPAISGVRLNTVMPTKEPLEDLLKRLKSLAGSKDIWIDLKCRQLRTVHGAFYKAPSEPKIYEFGGIKHILDPSEPRSYGELRTPPWAEIEISHKVELDLSGGPIKCWMQDGYDSAWIVEICDGNKLIMLDGPQRVVGGGESINILHPSLEIKGYFTELDLQYIEAAKKAGIHNFMLSYVEKDDDIRELFDLDPKASAIAKIESKKGVKWVMNSFDSFNDRVRLMAARGDLYVEMGRPDKILRPLRLIAKKDPSAVLASRILTSLRKSSLPACSDITDITCMLEMGYEHFMIGDDICFNRDMLFLAVDILQVIGGEHGRAHSSIHP